jgi:FixJ family two-component response regulator
MNRHDSLVVALDDDRPILASLERLLSARGYPVRTHLDPDDLFRAGPPESPACLLLDYSLEARLNGIEVHAEMLRRGWNLPTIFLTAHGNIPLVVQAMRSGADGFLAKPYDPEELLAEIERALAHARKLADDEKMRVALRAKVATLTPRERNVVALIVAGHINKEIADRLGLALVTVKVHRGRAMQKLGAGNPAELARIAIRAGIDGVQ